MTDPLAKVLGSMNINVEAGSGVHQVLQIQRQITQRMAPREVRGTGCRKRRTRAAFG